MNWRFVSWSFGLFTTGVYVGIFYRLPRISIPSKSSLTNLSIPLFRQESQYHVFQSKQEVSLWIDVPNSFPWRECLHVWDGYIITLSCDINESMRQNFVVIPLETHPRHFKLLSMLDGEEYCVEPEKGGTQVHVTTSCSDSPGWRWSHSTGHIQWEEYCLSSTGSRGRVKVGICDHTQEDQMVEIGKWTEGLLRPLNETEWLERMTKSRDSELSIAKQEVDTVLEDIRKAEVEGEIYRQEGTRRAVVFYLDQGSGFLKYLNWWLLVWRTIGLNSEKEEFDIILMTHPTSIPLLPPECQPIPLDFDPYLPGPGRCLYRELISIFERDHHYDHYLNSQECLFNPRASFLSKYSILLRADIDTFPTPAMLGLRPSRQVVCYRREAYTHYRPEIEEAIVDSATAAGITHKHWHNTASSWMGPSRRILALARLTTALSRFIRVHMFGPGTKCRCATCTQLPKDCQWGTGIYAGTLLLYAQEIALNRLWSKAEYEAGGKQILDGSTTDSTSDICSSALLHARHNAEPYSKFAFIDGKYSDWDLSTLDITKLRDYCMYFAITSAGQGTNKEAPIHRYNETSGGVSLSNYCTQSPLL